MKIAIFGTGGHGRSVMENIISHNQGLQLVFLDDDKPIGEKVNGVPVVGNRSELFNRDFLQEYSVIIGVGDCKLRGELSRGVLSVGGTLAQAFHATAWISNNGTKIGTGTVVMPFAIIGPNVTIGKYCIINNRATVAHDSIVEDGVNVSDGASFRTHVGTEAWIGLHVSVIPGTPIGARAIVGAGSVVTKAVEPDTTVAGVPARLIKRSGTHHVD